MKYNININQVKCQEYGLNFSQGAVMDALLSLSTRATQFKEIEGSIYYRLTTGKLVEELPVISDKKNTFLHIIKKLIEKGLLDRHIAGNLTYYKLTEQGKSFYRGVEKNPNECGKKSTVGVEKIHDNNNTINNTTINNNINNISENSETNTQTSNNNVDVNEKQPIFNGGERFEECWKVYPSFPGRGLSKKICLDFYRRINYSVDEIYEEVMLKNLMVKYEIEKANFVRGFNLFLRDFKKTEGTMLQKIIKQIMYVHMKKPIKIREDAQLLLDTFGKESFDRYVKEYNKEFNSITFDFK